MEQKKNTAAQAEQEEKKLTKIQIRRKELRELSWDAKQMWEKELEQAKKEGNQDKIFWLVNFSVNDMLVYYIYGRKELRTFKQWREAGYRVKKGAKAKLLWGRPIAKWGEEIRQVEQDEKIGDDNILLYPVVFLFSEDDVFKIQPKELKERKEEETPKDEKHVII